jgi:hypothetical protein
MDSPDEPTVSPEAALRAALDSHAEEVLGMTDSKPSAPAREDTSRRPSSRDLPAHPRAEATEDVDDDYIDEIEDEDADDERESDRERRGRHAADDADEDDEDEDDEPDEEEEDERPTRKPKGEQAKGKKDPKGEQEDDEDDERDAPHQRKDSDEEDTFDAAAKRFKIPTTFAKLLEKVPEAQRPEFERALTGRLASMESGFTRAMQEARTYRQEEAELRAELRLGREQPEHAFMAALRKDPKAVERLNALMEKFDRNGAVLPDYDAEHAKALGAAKTAEQTQRDQATKAAERAARIQTYAERRAGKAGVPWEFVEEAVAFAVATSETGDISEADVDEIVKRKAADWGRHTRAFRREGKKSGMRELRQGARRERERPHARVSSGASGAGRAPGSSQDRERARDQRRERAGKTRTLEEMLTASSKRIAPDLPDR